MADMTAIDYATMIEDSMSKHAWSNIDLWRKIRTESSR